MDKEQKSERVSLSSLFSPKSEDLDRGKAWKIAGIRGEKEGRESKRRSREEMVFKNSKGGDNLAIY